MICIFNILKKNYTHIYLITQLWQTTKKHKNIKTNKEPNEKAKANNPFESLMKYYTHNTYIYKTKHYLQFFRC